MLLIYLGLIDAVRSCAKTQQVVTELHSTKYVCTRTETTMTRCVFTECTYDTPGSECQNKEETTCMIQSSDGQIFGDVSCTKYALERLSDSIKKPILAYLKEQENDRARQLDSEASGDYSDGDMCENEDDDELYDECLYKRYVSDRTLDGVYESSRVKFFSTTGDLVIFAMSLVFCSIAIILFILLLKLHHKCCWKKTESDYTMGKVTNNQA